ncbi:hypothetical protein VDIAB_271131 [Vibrio diabolicus]|nr:hypothetical protein VDIAB_271131 [Vibrio diabolicus]
MQFKYRYYLSVGYVDEKVHIYNSTFKDENSNVIKLLTVAILKRSSTQVKRMFNV